MSHGTSRATGGRGDQALDGVADGHGGQAEVVRDVRRLVLEQGRTVIIEDAAQWRAT